jgi:hypothetical protein
MSEVFVFGSNLQGIHGKGAAKSALLEHGAIFGQGEGRQGQSYAIPTKATPYVALTLVAINTGVARFLDYAEHNPSEEFLVTPIGCGLAGYQPFQIAPMFALVRFLDNVQLPPEFLDYLPNNPELLTNLNCFN